MIFYDTVYLSRIESSLKSLFKLFAIPKIIHVNLIAFAQTGNIYNLLNFLSLFCFLNNLRIQIFYLKCSNQTNNSSMETYHTLPKNHMKEVKLPPFTLSE